MAEAGYLLEANAERHLKTPEEMARLFRDHPQAIANTLAIAKACRFSLDELRYEYPRSRSPRARRRKPISPISPGRVRGSAIRKAFRKR